MKNKSAIIIGGTGQFGIILGKILKKKNLKFILLRDFKKKLSHLKKNTQP